MNAPMSDEAKALRNAYARAYREKNKEKVRQYYKEYRDKNREKVRKYSTDFWERKAAAANPVTIQERARLLHEQGFSLREIGSRLNVSHMTVKRLLQMLQNDTQS